MANYNVCFACLQGLEKIQVTLDFIGLVYTFFIHETYEKSICETDKLVDVLCGPCHIEM